ncbi:hypothetical protein CRG98_015376 [Punica granatum]|uniref:GDSL esterase/lipase At2g04570-like n=1 Tax=Punica granatum TaxID=22663 RepID=A0A2I0K6K6_PUNGR|nr:hypothetical protein CRG98_015376 [Punica granatum]
MVAGANGQTAKVPAVIVFGDSSVDAGNNNVISTVLKSNFEPYGRDFFDARPTGRFSNGRIPPDFISEAFGLRPFVPAYLDPMYNISDFAIGVCFASAGTGYDNETSNVLNVIPMWKELEYYTEYQQKLRSYLGGKKAYKIISEALYIVSLGTNDFLENYYSSFPIPGTNGGGRRAQFPVVGQFEDFLMLLAEGFIRELHRLGARKISFTGIPPMGCLPLERTTNFMGQHECMEEYNAVAKDFNGKLGAMVDRMNRELPRLRMVFSNPYDKFYEIINKPSAFGFDVVSVACCATGLYEMSYLCNRQSPFTCTDASKYVFWDSFHPTEKTSQILAEYLIKSLLLPTFS